MTIPAIYAETPLPLTDTACRGHTAPLQGEGIFGCALTIAMMRNAAGEALLQTRRLLLLNEARRLRNLRRSKAASICEAELRRVTLAILAQGEPC